MKVVPIEVVTPENQKEQILEILHEEPLEFTEPDEIWPCEGDFQGIIEDTYDDGNWRAMGDYAFRAKNHLGCS